MRAEGRSLEAVKKTISSWRGSQGGPGAKPLLKSMISFPMGSVDWLCRVEVIYRSLLLTITFYHGGAAAGVLGLGPQR
jgi:hypothetical protein